MSGPTYVPFDQLISRGLIWQSTSGGPFKVGAKPRLDWTHKSITFKLEHNIPRLEPIHPHFYSIPTALLFGSTEKLFSALEVPCMWCISHDTSYYIEFCDKYSCGKHGTKARSEKPNDLQINRNDEAKTSCAYVIWLELDLILIEMIDEAAHNLV